MGCTINYLFVTTTLLTPLTSIFRAEKMLPITAENMGDDDLTALDEDQKYHIEYETEPSRDAILGSYLALNMRKVWFMELF